MGTLRTMIAVSTLVLGFALFGAVEAAAQKAVDKSREKVGPVISALNHLDAEVEELAALTTLTVDDVRVVHVDAVFEGESGHALHEALDRHDLEVVELRNALTGNAVVIAALEADDLAVTDVVALDVLDGGVTLYVQTEASATTSDR